MKLILVACVLALAAAAPQDPAPKAAVPLPPPFGHPQFSNQYYNPYTGPYNPYSGAYNPYSGPYNPYSGPYNAHHYGGFRPYDPLHKVPQYDPKVYKPHPAVDPKYFEQYHHHVPILEQSSQTNPDGSFKYSYATADGQQAEAEGFAKPNDFDPSDVSNSIRGSYSYTSPDGTPVSYTYIADEHGFRVEGSHVPKIPEAIQRSLEYNEHFRQFPRGPYGKSLPIPVPGVAPIPAAAPANQQ